MRGIRIQPRCSRAVARAVAAVALGCALPQLARAQVAGAIGIHDPSSVIKDGSTYFLYGTGGGIYNKWSPDGVNWNDEPTGVFLTPPAWTTQAVPGFGGFFWAPDIAYFNGKYHLYYSVSSWGSIDSAIGVATATTLNRTSPNYGWTDQGKVVQSDAFGSTQPETDTTAYNAIDPGILVDGGTGRVWMSWGSYSSGIVVSEINPSSGKRLNNAMTLVANNAPGGGWGSSIEGSSLVKRGSYYYLFVNYGGCCAGVNSTYDIRVGRSTNPTGPFVDKNGVDMRSGGGTLFLDDDGKYVGPGRFARFIDTDGMDYYGYHYYNGDVNGAPTFNKQELYWTSDAWPSAFAVNPDWNGSLSDSWALAANWSNATIPNGVGHVANFGNMSATRATIQLGGSGRTVGKVNFYGTGNFTISNTGQTLTLDADAGESATINANAGTHTIAAPINAVDRLAVNVTSGARVHLNGMVTGTELTKYGHGTLALNGTAAFTDAILLKWGFVEINGAVSANAFTSLGQAAFEGSTMVVRGSGSFTTSADLNVGDTGNAVDAANGWLEVHDNANVTVNSTGGFYVGSGFFANTRANGTVTQTGGMLTASSTAEGAFVIGGRNSSLATGIYNLSGGTVNANTNVRVGGAGTGTINQTGGAFNATGFVSIGRLAGATGTWNISAGTLNQTNASRSLIVGEAGAGTLTVSGSGHVSTATPLRIGLSGTGSGVVNLDGGGTLTTRGLSRGTGSATFNFNGGTLRPIANTTAFIQGLTTGNVKAGGAVIDTQAFNVTIAQPLLHDAALGGTRDGGLTKLGAGTLTLTGNNTYTGGTTVRAGGLHVSGGTTGVATPTGPPDVNIEIAPANTDTAAMTVSGSAAVRADRVIVAGNAANNAGGAATLTQTGGTIDASQWFAVGSVGSGTFDMSGGTLNQNHSGVSQMEVAVFGAGHSTANISGTARVNILNDGNFSIGVVNNSGSGTVNHNGGEVTFYSDAGTTVGGTGNVILGQFGPTGTYTYNLNGGTLTTGAVTRAASGATAILNLSGGMLKAAREGANLISNLSAARVQAGGAIIDTNGYGVSIVQPLMHDPSGAATDGGLTKSGDGTLTLAAPANVYTGPTHVAAGTLAIADTGSKNNVLNGGALVIAPAARLDIKNNKLITTTPAGAATNFVYGGVQGDVQRAFDGGAWDQPGLTTSMPDALTGLTGIGVATGAQLRGLGPGDTDVFAGETITAASTIAMYTYVGDANLDGFLSADDYSAIDFNVAVPGADGWYNGDFNWDGFISADDYSAIDFNLVAQREPFPTSGSAGAVVAVPEPMSMLALLAVLPSIAARRRRRR